MGEGGVSERCQERSHSLPSTYGLQYRVQGSPQPAPFVPSHDSELRKVKALLKRQQEQLDQLGQAMASMQARPFLPRSPRNGPLICRRCQLPGHYASGERVPPRLRAGSTTVRPASVTGLSCPAPQPEN